MPHVGGLPVFVAQGESDFSYPARRDTKVPFIVQRYVQGPSLKQIGDGRKFLDESEAAKLLRDLLKALLSLHLKGIVARVITPDSVRIDETTGLGTFLHLDYAKLVHSAPLSDDPSGQLTIVFPQELDAFLPPEVSRGSAEQASDQYALAASLLYACGIRRRKGESWKETLEGSSLIRLQEIFSIMLSENPRGRFGSVDAALSHLEHYCLPDKRKVSESEEDLLDEMELELGGVQNEPTISPSARGYRAELKAERNVAALFLKALPCLSVENDLDARRRAPEPQTPFSRHVLLILLGISIAFSLKYVETLLRRTPETERREPAASGLYSSPSYLTLTQLDGRVSFEVPRGSRVAETIDENGVEVAVSVEGGTLKFSSWVLEREAVNRNAREGGTLLEEIGKGIFRRSTITSIGPLSKTRDGYSYRDFRAEGTSGTYVTRVILVSSERAISMSTRAIPGANDSFPLERVRFIESLRIAPVVAH